MFIIIIEFCNHRMQTIADLNENLYNNASSRLLTTDRSQGDAKVNKPKQKINKENTKNCLYNRQSLLSLTPGLKLGRHALCD